MAMATDLRAMFDGPVPDLTPPEPAQEIPDEDIESGLQTVVGSLDEISRQVGALGQTIGIMSDRLDAPTEIVRDNDGNAVGVTKAGRLMRIVRDEEGRASGVVPVEQEGQA